MVLSRSSSSLSSAIGTDPIGALVMLADIALRRRVYAEPELFTPAGRYGNVRWFPVLVVIVNAGVQLGRRPRRRSGPVGYPRSRRSVGQGLLSPGR